MKKHSISLSFTAETVGPDDEGVYVLKDIKLTEIAVVAPRLSWFRRTCRWLRERIASLFEGFGDDFDY